MRTTAECGYLPLAPPGVAVANVHGLMRHVSLYHAGGKDKGVYALHMPASGTAVLVVVAPGVTNNRRGADGEVGLGEHCPPHHRPPTRTLNPRVLIQMASYDVASNLCMAGVVPSSTLPATSSTRILNSGVLNVHGNLRRCDHRLTCRPSNFRPSFVELNGIL
jgi:hypothetical protein